EAIRILQKSPEKWSTQALSELVEKLKMTPQRFTVEYLQKAHEIHYQKALVDIISMVKHAADRENKLYTASERVARAFERVTAGKTITTDQQLRIKKIKSHTKTTLS